MAAVNVIISVMIGSGIFVSPTAALKYSGSIGMCLVVWTACGVISLMGKSELQLDYFNSSNSLLFRSFMFR